MASSDEEDLEALRLAALATLKQKQEIQQPQGIQVLGSISSVTNQYHQDGVGMHQENYVHGGMHPGNFDSGGMHPGNFDSGGMHPGNFDSGGMHPGNFDSGGMHPVNYVHGGMHPENYVYQDYGEVPYAFQQAVLKQQMRGRGRGFQRGRGRGRGNRFHPKPAPQSALIVIQVEGKEEEQQPKIEEKPKDSRPFLLRPQDKWASTEGSSQDSTPTRPKDTSKFSRYDDETDSEEDEYVDKSTDIDNEPSGLPMNISLDDVSSDTEIDISKTDNELPEVEVHNNHQDDMFVRNESDNEMEGITGDSKNDVVDTGVDTSGSNTEIANDNRIVTDQGVQYLPNKTETKPAAASGSLTNDTDNGAISDITELRQGNKSGDLRNIIKNRSITVLSDTCYIESSDSTPLRDEGTPVLDELRQDDSVSNSYVTFSRFNRRNRRDSNSGSEEDDDNDNDDNGDNDDDILKSDSQSDKDSISSVSDCVLEGNDLSENEEELSEKEVTSRVSPDTKSTAKTIKQSQDVKLPVSPSVNSRKSSLSSAASSPSESSSSSESDSDVSSTTNSNDKKKLTSENQSIKSSTCLKLENIKNQEDLAHSHNSAKHNSYHKTNIDRKEVPAESSGKSERKGRRNSDEHKEGRTNRGERSLKYNDKKSHHDKYSSNHIKADPEFDATNYRDEKMYTKNDRRNKSQDRGNRDNKPSKLSPESSRNPSESSKRNKIQGENHGSFDKHDVKKGRDKDKRHFEEIGRLKGEEEKSRKSKYPNISKSSLAEDEKTYHSNVDNRSKSCVKNDSNQDSKKLKDHSRGNKSEQYLSNSKSAKFSKSSGDTKDREKVKDRSERKSLDNAKSKSSASLSRRVSSDTKKHKKEQSVKDTTQSSSESESDSDSERSVSSLSDMSSDSETESWRDRKRGATRKTADIELEKRRREIKERNKRRENERGKTREERGDGDASRYIRHGHRDHKRDKRFSPERGSGKFSNRDNKERGKIENDFESSYKYSNKKHKHFVDEDRRSKTNFEEMSSSESDSEIKKHRGVVSVVKSEKTKVSSEIPSLLKISVNKPKLDSANKSRKSSSSKPERLIIQVEKSDDESTRLETKHKKKKKKDRKSWSSDEDSGDEGPRKQVVNVTFNEEPTVDKSRKSVYDRLGISVSKTSKSRKDSESRESRDVGFTKRSHDGQTINIEKRIKLDVDGKYSSRREKSHKTNSDEDQDSVLNQRIKKIKEKNAEILRRKQLVEQDKQIYG